MKTSITTRPCFVFPRVFWLKSMRSACSRSFGPLAVDLPSARGRGACACRPTSAFSASKAMACVTSRSRCRASRYSFRGSRTLKSARSLSASIEKKQQLCCPKKELVQGSWMQEGLNTVFFLLVAPKRSLLKVPWMQGGLLTQLLVLRPQASTLSSRAWKPLHTPHSTLVR